MDRRFDCSMQGFIEISANQRAVITLRTNGQKEYDTQRCEMRFQAVDQRQYIKIEFEDFFIGSCTVTLIINDARYTCQSSSSSRLLENRQVYIVLARDLNDNQYSGNIIVSTYSKDFKDVVPDEVSNPTLIGIIIGVVCGIIIIILIIAIAGHCYYKSLKRKHPENFDGNGSLTDCEQSSTGIGYINEGVKNGGIIKKSNSPKNNDRSLLSHHEEVNQFYDYLDDNKKQNDLNINILPDSPKKLEFDNDPGKMNQTNSNMTPKSPVLNALHSSPKFQASFKFNEAEAEERERRFSQGSTLPPTPPPLPTVPTSPHLQSSQINSTHAGIRRVPKISASTEDMEHLERELQEMEKPEPSKFQSNPNPSISMAKNVHIPVATSLPPQSAPETTPSEIPSSKDSGNTQHTLRPTRAQDKKKHSDITDGQPVPPRPQRTYKEKDGTNSLRKRGHKVPKSTKGKQYQSDTDSNVIYGDDPSHRSDTPMSEVSSRMPRTDDNESLPPLQRTTSRQSLFASRSSLYARRGKRERRSSISESVTSYAHDDLDMSMQQDPMDRRDARIFKSLGDITKNSKDGSDQEHSRKSASKKLTHKKPASSRKFSSSTQTNEQRGTQTETAQKKPTANSAASSLSNAKPMSYVQDDVNVMQPAEMSKSQFKPISKASDMSCSPIGHQYRDNHPMSLEGAEPTKSPWELLCELTDGEMKSQDNSLPFGNPPYNSDFLYSGDGQSRPSIDNLPTVYHPSISSQVSDKESYASGTAATISYPPSIAYNPPSNLYPRKSSWEALKELTDNQLSYPSGASESIV